MAFYLQNKDASSENFGSDVFQILCAIYCFSYIYMV